MSALLISVVLFLTIVAALVLGVASGYGAVIGVLHIMGHRSQSGGTGALTTAEVGSGD